MSAGGQRSLTGLVIALTVMLGCGGDSTPPVRITPGVLELYQDGAQPRLRIARRDTQFSRRHPEAETYGFLLEPLALEPIEVATVHYLPAPPARIGGGFDGQKPEDWAKGLRDKPIKVTAARFFDFFIEPDDPLGPYRVEVYVNGKLADVVRFEVVE